MRIQNISIAVLGLITSACATFPQYRIGRVPAPVQVENCSPAQPLHIEIQYGNDERLRDKSAPRFLKGAVDKVAGELKECFSTITVSTSAADDHGGLHLKLKLQLHNNVVKEAAVGFVSGFSSFLVPVWCTYPHTLTASVSNSQKQELSSVVLKDSVRLYMHALLLLYPKTPASAVNNMFENMVRDVFQKLDWGSLAK